MKPFCTALGLANAAVLAFAAPALAVTAGALRHEGRLSVDLLADRGAGGQRQTKAEDDVTHEVPARLCAPCPRRMLPATMGAGRRLGK